MEKKRIVNLIIWLAVAVGLMIGTYFAWSEEGNYGWLQFLASFLFDFGFCFVLWFWCDDFIKDSNRQIYMKMEDCGYYKTFEDLSFRPMNEKYYEDGQQAIMYFDNGYGVSVLCGRQFYSNGINSFEIGILKDRKLSIVPPFEDAVLGYRTEEEVTDIMIKLQKIDSHGTTR